MIGYTDNSGLYSNQVSAPFAMADLMSSDFVELLIKIGGQ